MTKQDVLNNYNRLLLTKELDYNKLDLLSKVGYNHQMSSLSEFKGPKIHTNWKQLMLIDNNIIEYIQSRIDENVIILEISSTSVKIEYVFREEIVEFDISNIKERN